MALGFLPKKINSTRNLSFLVNVITSPVDYAKRRESGDRAMQKVFPCLNLNGVGAFYHL
jgi:hypothetical protein